MLQTKNSAIPLEAKAVDDTGTIEGYASIFGVIDSYNEVVEPGAFSPGLVKAAREGRKIKMLYQHDAHQPIGVWDDLAEDKKGLYVKGRLLIDASPKAKEVYGLLKEGALDGLSIGYRTIKSEPKEGKPGVISLRQVDLFENSIVTFAANQRARVETVKSMLDAGGAPTLREFEETLRELGFSRKRAEAMAKACEPHLKGDPEGKVDPSLAFFTALRA